MTTSYIKYLMCSFAPPPPPPSSLPPLPACPTSSLPHFQPAPRPSSLPPLPACRNQKGKEENWLRTDWLPQSCLQVLTHRNRSTLETNLIKGLLCDCTLGTMLQSDLHTILAHWTESDDLISTPAQNHNFVVSYNSFTVCLSEPFDCLLSTQTTSLHFLTWRTSAFLSQSHL